jgi:segregation and condensation protein B
VNEFRVDAALPLADAAAEPSANSNDSLDTDDAHEAVEEVETLDPVEEVETLDPTLPPAEPGAFADPGRLRAAVEAVLFVVESPVSAAQLATVVQVPTVDIEAALADLEASYADGDRGIELRWIAGGVRIYTRPEFTGVVEAFLLEGQRTKLSQAALETLAVIAYRQPVTRGRIAAIRGVNVDGVVRTLSSRGLIIEVGSDPDTGGGLFRTTDSFLEKMGLRSLEELPSLAPLLPEIDNLDTDEL